MPICPRPIQIFCTVSWIPNTPAAISPGSLPHIALAKEMPSLAKKLALRNLMDLGPPNWFYDLMISTPAMRWFARQIYFHRRAEPGDTLADFERRLGRWGSTRYDRKEL